MKPMQTVILSCSLLSASFAFSSANDATKIVKDGLGDVTTVLNNTVKEMDAAVEAYKATKGKPKSPEWFKVRSLILIAIMDKVKKGENFSNFEQLEKEIEKRMKELGVN